MEKNNNKIKKIIFDLLKEIGENPDRQGLLKTPERVEKSWKYITKGYDQDIKMVINNALFDATYDEMVTVKDIEFYSICEHHLLPFFGKAHVGYIPNGKILGLSKIPRIIEMYARRLQVQERMTQEIAETLNNTLKPKGVAVILEGRHLCMQMRGVENKNSYSSTSFMTGLFREDSRTRKEFLEIISMRNKI